MRAVKRAALVHPTYVSVRTAAHFVRSRCLASPELPGGVEVIAHRGASSAAPENTLASIELAWAMGANAVEVDVHLSADHRIVAIHDTSTKRTGRTDLEVATTPARRLRCLDVGRHKHRRFAGERIPFLEEVLATIPSGRRLFIEVKCGAHVLPLLKRVVTCAGKRHQIAVIGFALDTVKTAKTLMPDVPTYWLCDTSLWKPFDRRVVDEARRSGLDGLDARWFGITPHFVRAVKAAGLELYTWTVNDPAVAAWLGALGVEGVTTNYPDRLGCPRSAGTLATRRATKRA